MGAMGDAARRVRKGATAMARVLVTGGTGELGRAVVARLVAAGHSVRVLSRTETPRIPPGVEAARGDLATGVGALAAVATVEVVVHCASNGHRTVEVAGTARLVAAAAAAGVRRLVYISIVGVDRNPFAYYRAKLDAEGIVARGDVPWTILRATQFHSLILRVLRAQGRLPALLVPRGFRLQPIAAEDVAARLVELALGDPIGYAPDMGGPDVCTVEDLAWAYLAAAQERRPLLSVPIPGRAARAFRDGAHVTPERTVGALTWDDYLRAQMSAPAGMTAHDRGIVE